ncbi:hypothetical protein BLX42_10660 [Pseudomonas sp. SG-MS2]|nr:hypothetical protein BLX42_10660 [Pseudomonas sp. SG-MS2]
MRMVLLLLLQRLVPAAYRVRQRSECEAEGSIGLSIPHYERLSAILLHTQDIAMRDQAPAVFGLRTDR